MSRWIFLALVLTVGWAQAAQRVAVLALFPGKAMLQIDGQRKVLGEGESHPSGVRLLQATPQEARVLIHGEERVLTLGTTVNASYAQPSYRELRLVKTGSAFFTDGLINGQPVRMLVDTGATTMALSESLARRLGISYMVDGVQTRIGTASGVAKAYGVKLRSLKVGTQTFSDVDAVVVEGDSPRNALLGMNVLGRFEIEQQQNLMILRSLN